MKNGDIIQKIGKTVFKLTRGTDSKGHLRRDWFLTIIRPNGRFCHFTGFDRPERVVEYARTFKRRNQGK